MTRLRTFAAPLAALTGLILVSTAIAKKPPPAPAPPKPFSQNFAHNTNGWYGSITHEKSGYSNAGGYADGINSAKDDGHARLNGEAITFWGSNAPSTSFPKQGFTTSMDVYLDTGWAASHPDARFDWDTALSRADGSFFSDFVFNAGTNPAGDASAPGFYVNASTNAGRGGAYPENPCPDPGATKPPNTCRTPVHITTSGWYTFVHRFRNDNGHLATDFLVIQDDPKSGDPKTLVASWTISQYDPNTSQPIAIGQVGGPVYGDFVTEEIPDLAIDQSALDLGAMVPGAGHGF